MKLFLRVGAFVSLCNVSVYGVKSHLFLHRNGTNGSDQDNFQDELVDQADPEFKKYSQGDNCISWDDMIHVVLQQCQGCSKAESKSAVKREMKRIRDAFDEADKNKDECIDKKEFKKAHEFEGTAPEKPDNVEKQNKDDFDMMDVNNDGMVSKQEAMDFCHHNMPHADVDYGEFKKMFDAADKDKNGFISREEFDNAGKEYEGDGSEVPPPAATNGSNATNATKPEKKKKALFFFAHPRFEVVVKLAIEKMKAELAFVQQDPCAGCDERAALNHQKCANEYGDACKKDAKGQKADISCCIRQEKHARCLKCKSVDDSYGTATVNKNYYSEREMKLKR